MLCAIPKYCSEKNLRPKSPQAETSVKSPAEKPNFFLPPPVQMKNTIKQFKQSANKTELINKFIIFNQSYSSN